MRAVRIIRNLVLDFIHCFDKYPIDGSEKQFIQNALTIKAGCISVDKFDKHTGTNVVKFLQQ